MRNDNFEELIAMARAGRGGERMATFKTELDRLVRGDREGLRIRAISDATEYDDWKTDEEFLNWLWRELYPNEPVPGHDRPSSELLGAERPFIVQDGGL